MNKRGISEASVVGGNGGELRAARGGQEQDWIGCLESELIDVPSCQPSSRNRASDACAPKKKLMNSEALVHFGESEI